jgi:hypothetical protein
VVLGLQGAKVVSRNELAALPKEQTKNNMIRFFTTTLLVACATLAMAQTQLHISNLTVTEKDDVRRGTDVTASLNRAQGKKGLVIFADQQYAVEGTFKVKTHNVRRQSAKQGAVYLTMNMRLKVDGKRHKRLVQKTFYAEQDRTASFSEAFLIKRGIDVRKITVAFDGRIQ